MKSTNVPKLKRTKIAYLNARLDEISVDQRPGFIKKKLTAKTLHVD